MEATDLSRLSLAEQRLALRLIHEREDRRAKRLFFEMYPEEDRVWDGHTTR